MQTAALNHEDVFMKIEEYTGQAIDTYRKTVSKGGGERDARHQTVSAMAEKIGQSGSVSREDARHLADAAIKAYAGRALDMAPDKAREAAVRDISRPKEAGLDVKNFSRS